MEQDTFSGKQRSDSWDVFDKIGSTSGYSFSSGLPCSLYPQVNLDSWRPKVGLPCQTCFEDEYKKSLSQESETRSNTGLYDLLAAGKPSYNRKSGRIRYTNPYTKVLRSERVKNSVVKAALQDLEKNSDNLTATQLARQQKAQEKVHQNRTKQLLKTMAASVSKLWIRLMAWLLLKVFSRLLTGIYIHQGQIARVQRISEERKVPVMYLPLHKSHLDYLLISLVLWLSGVRLPHVASGDNLRLPIFSYFINAFGGFFIKRKLDPIEGQKDYVYRAVLHTENTVWRLGIDVVLLNLVILKLLIGRAAFKYMEELLKAGESLEFFIEAGRSRSGKAVVPKAGLLSVAMDTFLQGVVPDILIVPVNISYDRLMEGNYCHELTGKPKQKETIFGSIKSLFAVFNRNFGAVRIDVGTPTSLKEYMDALHPTYPAMRSRVGSMVPGCVGSSPRHSSDSHIAVHKSSSEGHSVLHKSISSKLSSGSLYGTANVIEDEHRSLVQSICNHVIYDCVRATSIMSTQMVAFLLLNKHRSGCRLREIVADFDFMTKELFARERDVGYNGDMLCTVVDAINLIGPELVAMELSDIDSGIDMQVPAAVGENQRSSSIDASGQSSPLFVKPVLNKLMPALELSYYNNAVISVFQLDAVVATALFAACPERIEAVHWPDEPEKPEIFVSRDKLLSKALLICDSLQFDFFFCPPCASIDTVLSDTIDQFVKKHLLIECRPSSAQLENQRKRVICDLVDESEDSLVEFSTCSQQLKINQSEDAVSFLRFLSRTIGPFIEAYSHTVLYGLPYLQQIPHSIKETELIKDIFADAMDRAENCRCVFIESTNTELIRNCLRLLERWKVLESSFEKGARRVALEIPYSSNAESLESLLRIFRELLSVYQHK